MPEARPPAAQSLTILADRSLGDVRRMLRGLSSASRAASAAGLLGPVSARLGTLGPGGRLAPPDVTALAAEAHDLGLAGLEVVPLEVGDHRRGLDQLAAGSSADLLLLLDAAAHPAPGLLVGLLGALADGRVGVIGPRRLPVAAPVRYDRRTGDVPTVPTAVCLARRAAVEAAGGLGPPGDAADEAFAHRVRAAGWRVVEAPRAAVFLDPGVGGWAGPDGPAERGRHRLRADPEASEVPASFVADAARAARRARSAARPVEAFASRAGLGVEGGPAAAPPGPRPALSVVVRTQGRRMPLLEDALTCLAGQTHDDFEVLVVVHDDDEAVARAVAELVGRFDATFVARSRVERVEGGGRSRPLNVGLDLARGAYVAFLDDDDVVAATWAEAFAAGAAEAPGRIIRSRCATRALRRLAPSALADHEPVGEVELPYDATFDYVWHLRLNSTPICSVALPLDELRARGLRFDEALPVVEDWDLLMRAAQLTGVHDTGEVTSIYHHWEGAGTSRALHEHETWRATWLELLGRWDREPLLLPPGSVVGLVDGGAFPEMLAEYWRIRGELERARERLAAVEGATWWKLTAPPRWAITRLKGARRPRGGTGPA